MKTAISESSQMMQRIKVGMTGLTLVVLLIALDGTVRNSASKDQAVDVAGGPKADVVANLSVTNDSAPAAAATPSEPLAEVGVTPSAPADDAKAATANQTAPVPTGPQQAQPPGL